MYFSADCDHIHRNKEEWNLIYKKFIDTNYAIFITFHFLRTIYKHLNLFNDDLISGKFMLTIVIILSFEFTHEKLFSQT